MVERIPTGIKGLDELVDGGFPKGSVILVSGPSGAGKSLFSLSYLVGENGGSLYVTVEEPKRSLIEGGKGIGLDIMGSLDSGSLLISDLTSARMLSDSDAQTEEKIADFTSIASIIENEVRKNGVQRVVVDSLTALGVYYNDPNIFRQELFRFTQILRNLGVTTILVGESGEEYAGTKYGIEQFVCDGYLLIDLEKIEGELRRTINVRKMRYTKHDSSVHPMLILRSGIRISVREKVY